MRPERVAAASRDWVWVPDNATRLGTGEFLLVRFPDWADRPLQLVLLEPAAGRELPALLDEVLAAARTLDHPELTWWVKLGAPADLDDRVRALGGVLDETLDVLAVDLADGVPDSLRDSVLDGGEAGGVELRWVDGVATLRDSHAVMAAVFGGRVPPPERLEVEAALTRADLEQGRGGAVVAYADDRPVGTGGLTVVGDVARLWSGAVVEEHRGRGVYRALLGARLGLGVEQGASLGLVKGRVETSGPILQRAGFTAYGEERSYAVPLSGAPTR